MSKLTFEWDPRKAAANRRKHGVSFEEATTVFDDPAALLLADWSMASLVSLRSGAPAASKSYSLSVSKSTKT